MTELKTLKDIIPYPTLYSARQRGKTGMSIQAEYIRDELRQEAIKWVNNPDFTIVLTAKEWIMQFFNLTEDDLK